MSRIAGNRQKIVDAAWDLFWERGYHGTSIQDIARRAKVPKGSVYNYFDSKDHLMMAVLDRLKYQIESELRLKVLVEGGSPSKIVRKLLDHYEELFSRFGYGRGDLLGSRISELADLDSPVVGALRKLHTSWKEVVAQKIWAYGAATRTGPLMENAAEIASIIWSTLQGALLQMKISHSNAPLEEARNVLVPMVSSYVTALATGEVVREE